MATLVAEAELNRVHLESSAGILGQQQQLEEAARKQVCYTVGPALTGLPGASCYALLQRVQHACPTQLNQQRLLCTKHYRQ